MAKRDITESGIKRILNKAGVEHARYGRLGPVTEGFIFDYNVYHPQVATELLVRYLALDAKACHAAMDRIKEILEANGLEISMSDDKRRYWTRHESSTERTIHISLNQKIG